MYTPSGPVLSKGVITTKKMFSQNLSDYSSFSIGSEKSRDILESPSLAPSGKTAIGRPVSLVRNALGALK